MYRGPNSYAVLPVGESIDPTTLDQSQYWDIEWVAYVLFKRNESRTRPTRVLTSHGPLTFVPSIGVRRDLKLGDVIHLEHDQTQAYLGEYEVVGIHREDNGAVVGDVPSIRIKHCVAK